MRTFLKIVFEVEQWSLLFVKRVFCHLLKACLNSKLKNQLKTNGVDLFLRLSKKKPNGQAYLISNWLPQIYRHTKLLNSGQFLIHFPQICNHIQILITSWTFVKNPFSHSCWNIESTVINFIRFSSLKNFSNTHFVPEFQKGKNCFFFS